MTYHLMNIKTQLSKKQNKTPKTENNNSDEDMEK